jgi:fumarylpyruvate hydrolase
VPKEDAGNVSDLALSLDVNGVSRQAGSTAQMLFGVSALVAYTSRWITLNRGDLIFTGTPAGVGPVVAGDKVEARLSDLATLSITIAGPA